jgi:transposase-like protein
MPKGMTTSDIEGHIREIRLEVSDSTISRVTDKILLCQRRQIGPWRNIRCRFHGRQHFHVRSEGQIVKKAVYVLSA